MRNRSSLAWGFLFGIIFGFLLQKGGVTKYDIIIGQLRLVIATLSIEEINQDREKFLEQITKNVGLELNKIGLAVINVNIRDITDESSYIEAIGKKAAAHRTGTHCQPKSPESSEETRAPATMPATSIHCQSIVGLTSW